MSALVLVDRTIFQRLRALDPAALLAQKRKVSPFDPVDVMIARLGAAFTAERRRATNAYAEADRRIAEFEMTIPIFVEAARAEFAGKSAPALRALADGDLTAGIDAPEVQHEFDSAVLLFAKTVFAFATSAQAIGSQIGDIAERAEAMSSRSRDEAGRYGPAREILRVLAAEIERNAEEQSRARAHLRGIGLS